MIQDSSTICWNKAGKELCEIVETNDFRMYFIMPYTLQQLGDVSDKGILDLGCGEGGYSRALAHNGANVTSIDCAIDPIDKIGFKLTDMNEPLPSEKQINLSPGISWLSKVPMFLFMELEK